MLSILETIPEGIGYGSADIRGRTMDEVRRPRRWQRLGIMPLHESAAVIHNVVHRFIPRRWG